MSIKDRSNSLTDPLLADPGLVDRTVTAARYQVRVIRDLRIPTADAGVTLSADLFLPVGVAVAPTLVTVLPYRKDAGWGILDFDAYHWYATRGYACLLVDFQGIGASGGRQRPPFHASEVDDGIAAVAWAAEQPWCDGNIGMWGHSYGAVLSMRVASRRPPQLRAILPLMGMLDPDQDFLHPGGARGGLAGVLSWGMQTFVNQLLPPLHDYGTVAQQQRWADRLRDNEPWLLDLARWAPGDPARRSRAVDVSSLTVPAFCVAGWRDIFCDGSIRAFEQFRGPKKLLVGPWMHTMPDVSPYQAVDIRGLSLRWWDHWLRGIDTGVLDEPPVTLFRQGHEPRWEQFDSWPPNDSVRNFATVSDTVLRPNVVSSLKSKVIAERMPDPTVGVLSGQWGMPDEYPLDQHDDDMRSLTCTSAPLTDQVVIGGRPSVTVRMVDPPGRLVVRLADVDPQGRSRMITSGVIAAPDATCGVELTSTSYAVAPGHRLRIVLGDADFPRLWPAEQPAGPVKPLRLSGVELALPSTDPDAGVVVRLAPPDGGDPAHDLGLHNRTLWTVTRDLINNGIDMTTGNEFLARTPDRDHMIEVRTTMSASVRPANPAAASARAAATAVARLASGERIVVRARVGMTGTTVSATGEIDVDDTTIFTQRWTVDVPQSSEIRADGS